MDTERDKYKLLLINLLMCIYANDLVNALLKFFKLLKYVDTYGTLRSNNALLKTRLPYSNSDFDKR